ncbi:unnamed protein product [Rotaria sp. Silwood1]|nr:unnamed protein product [Rotaria sp. Silwood1]
MQQTQISRISSSSDKLNDLSSDQILIHNMNQSNEHTLPLNKLPTIQQRTIYTQTTQNIETLYPSKSIPSFAETQLLSIYYPSKNSKNVSTNDKCIFFEQQNRQPIRYRTTYDPLSLTKSTQTSPLLIPLSTHSSTLIIHGNNSNYKQHVKIHSGNQNLSNDFTNDKYLLPNQLIEDSNYSYEEYVINYDEKQNEPLLSSSSSSSSVATVIPQTNEFQISSNNQRISSWPPVPDDILPIDNQYENDKEKHLSHVQFTENLNHMIPNINEKKQLTDINSYHVTEQLQQFDYHPINKSKSIEIHTNKSDNQINITTNHVNTLRTLFEQENKSSSIVTNPIKQIQKIEPKENLSKYGTEIRFHTKDYNTLTMHHAEPVQIIQQRINSSMSNTKDDQLKPPFKLDQIRQITGKSITNLNDIGHYLQDGHTWQWDEIFWLSLTNSQRDQLKDLEYQLHTHQNDSKCSSSSSSTNETKRFKSTINITGTDTWQQHIPQRSSSNITKYSEINPSINIINSIPNTTDLKIDSQTSTKKNDNQITIIEKSYTNSINTNKTNIDSSYEQSYIDSLSYEQFIYDYLSTYAKHICSNNNTLILIIDDQEIHISHIHLPSSNNNFILAKNIYFDFIDQDFLPYETESNQLVIFICGEAIILSIDRWLFYQKKYQNASWIHKLKCVNRQIPTKLIPIIEQWLSDHTTLSFDTYKLNVDGVIIPLKGKLGLHIIDLYKMQQLEKNYWHEIFKYLIRIGYVSYNMNEKLVHIANSELDVQRILVLQTYPSIELIERVANYLRTLDNVYIENNSLYLTDNFILPYEYIYHLLIEYKQGDNINAHELARVLLEICHIDENNNNNNNNQTIILTFNKQILEIKSSEKYLNQNHINILIQWLNNLKQKNLIEITKQNDIIIYFNDQNNYKQKLFIKHEHINTYMKKNNNNNQQIDIININDIANILFLYDYIQYSSGQFIFPMLNIILDTDELIWLQSIIHSIRSNEYTQQTEIELFNGQNTQILHIPYKYMLPTTDVKTIANYLFQNGHIEYDVNTKNYIYYYISLDENNHLIEEQLLSSNIQHIHIDKNNQHIELEFIHDPNHYLLLPSHWYQQILEHQFNRSYIIDMLLTNGGTFDRDNFIFNGHTYSLKPLNNLTLESSSKEKEDLIDNYVEYINDEGEIKYDNKNHILILENLSDGSKLYLTPEHTQFIHKNQYRREDMKFILIKYSQLKQDEFHNWLLYYNKQCIQIPSLKIIIKTHEQYSNNHNKENQTELLKQYHKIIDYMYNHNLITYNKNLKLFQINFSNQILTIPLNELQSIINIKNFHLLNNEILPFNSYQLSQWLLNNSSQINYYHNNSIEIIYKNKFYYLPLIYLKQQENFIDSKLKLIFPFNKSLRLIQKTPSTTTLDIEQPSIENNYTIDPLLILSNYIHRTSRIYQDELDRLVIKINHNEIVIPCVDAIDSIEAINTSPQRTGSIIARLINRIGKVQSNGAGGIIITVGKSSFELSKETIDNGNKEKSILQNQNLIEDHHRSNRSPNLPLLRHSKSVNNLSSSIIGEHPSFNDDQQMLYTKDGRGDARYLNLSYMDNLEQDHTNLQTSLDLKPCLLIIPDDETISSSNRPTRFYIQYTYEYDSTSNMNLNSTMISPSQNTIRSTQPQLISPNHYQNIALREAPVYLYKQGDHKIYYENLAQYLSIEQSYLSSRTVRRMLKFSSRDEYFAYLCKKMSTIHAEQLVQESEISSNKDENIYLMKYNNEQRSRSQDTLYNIQNGRSPQSINGTGVQSIITSEKNVTLPRSSTLSGQSNDGESESRTTVSRSASAVAKVMTSQSDTIKSTTSSSGPSSREVSPNRTSGSKGTTEEEVKKEKKSKFRTPSFLRKRKEKKEAASKDKSEK